MRRHTREKMKRVRLLCINAFRVVVNQCKREVRPISNEFHYRAIMPQWAFDFC